MNKTNFFLRSILVAAALFSAGCAQYSSVSERSPVYRKPVVTPAGALIVKAARIPRDRPESRLGGYLDAASVAARELQAHPGDAAAELDYNFAVARAVEVIQADGLQPWVRPVVAQGADGPWRLTIPANSNPERNPANFNIEPADRYQFHGSYVTTHSMKGGLGAPVIVTSKPGTDFTKSDPFIQGKHVYYGITAIIRFDGRRCVLTANDPLSMETVTFAGHTYPLAADYTAPIALALARENPRLFEIARLLRPDEYADSARLARLQPYDPRKIPVICVHGLMDSPATWAPLINSLLSDAEIRRRYQFWFYSYPSGYPYPYSAAIMRQRLDAMNVRYPGHKKLVLIGHSMGGVICRTLITDSGMTLWHAYFETPPAKTDLPPDARRVLTESLIFQHRTDVERVVFVSTPHRGSNLAGDWIGRLASRLVYTPATLLQFGEQVRKVITFDPTALNMNGMPNSIDTLAPNNRFVKAINTLPIAPGIPYHTIIGNHGKTDTAHSSDGVVPYWSSHLEGAQSELAVPSWHNAHQNPQAIEEIRRILKLNAAREN